jgi:hypothetical protein
MMLRIAPAARSAGPRSTARGVSVRRSCRNSTAGKETAGRRTCAVTSEKRASRFKSTDRSTTERHFESAQVLTPTAKNKASKTSVWAPPTTTESIRGRAAATRVRSSADTPPAPRAPPRSPRTPRRLSWGMRSFRPRTKNVTSEQCQDGDYRQKGCGTGFPIPDCRVKCHGAHQHDIDCCQKHRPWPESFACRPEQQCHDPRPEGFLAVVAHAGILPRDGKRREGEHAL